MMTQEGMKNQIVALKSMLGASRAVRVILQAENKRLRDALEAYADADNWRRHGSAGMYLDWWVTCDDGPDIARAALEPNP